MEEQVRALLRANAAIAARCAGRVNFGYHPQGKALPALVLNTISDTEPMTVSGASGLATARVQIDCYADTYGAAKHLSRDVRVALNGGAHGAIQGVFFDNARDGREQAADGTDVFRVSMDFTVHFSR